VPVDEVLDEPAVAVDVAGARVVLGDQVERPPVAEVAVVARRGLQRGGVDGVARVGVDVVGPDGERPVR
jgi:hypothetical protein